MERGAHRLEVLLVELHQLHYLVAQPLALDDLPGGDGLTQGSKRPHSSLQRSVDHDFLFPHGPRGSILLAQSTLMTWWVERGDVKVSTWDHIDASYYFHHDFLFHHSFIVRIPSFLFRRAFLLSPSTRFSPGNLSSMPSSYLGSKVDPRMEVRATDLSHIHSAPRQLRLVAGGLQNPTQAGNED